MRKYKFKRTLTSLSRISQLNIAGLAFLYSSIRLSTSGVATLGLLPPITPGLMLPVSWYRFKILDTQPWDTLSCRDMTHGRTPAAAISTIFNLIWFGSGRPLINTPPSWFIRPWPATKTNGLLITPLIIVLFSYTMIKFYIQVVRVVKKVSQRKIRVFKKWRVTTIVIFLKMYT